MDTLQDMREAVQSDLNVSTNSSLFPPATIDLALNRAYVNKVAKLFRWPQLEDAKTTTTQANINYYDAPTTWQPNSMWRLTIDGDSNVYGEEPDGSPMSYHDFLDWLADSQNENSTDKKWAVQWLRYFVYPTPTVAGLTISVWGQKNATKMTLDSSTTIFSYNMPECNEAIVLEAEAILKKKGENKDAGMMFSEEAKGILVTAYNKLRQEKAKFEKTQPFLNVPDYFSRSNSNSTIGNFDWD
jgi:hypothetical protein